MAVDDRSTDHTGDILAGLASVWPDRMRVLRVERLPEGWMGKNHALYLGGEEARGEWLLFTDADIRFAPGCLEDALGYAQGEGLDHLTLATEIISRGVLLRSFVAAFVLVFEVTQRPWRAADPRAREAVGVGAFNLVRREALPPGGNPPRHPSASRRRHEAREAPETGSVQTRLVVGQAPERPVEVSVVRYLEGYGVLVARLHTYSNRRRSRRADRVEPCQPQLP